MGHDSIGRTTRIALAASLALVSATLPAQDTDSLELKVKAAFLYNFARLATWPPDKLAGGAPLRVCVAERDPVAPFLREALAGKAIDGHPLVLEFPADTDGWERCHLAYGLAPWLRGLPEHGVLTVHEAPAAAPDGVIRLYLEERKLRFEVNETAVARDGVRLSSRLMSLATVVRSAP